MNIKQIAAETKQHALRRIATENPLFITGGGSKTQVPNDISALLRSRPDIAGANVFGPSSYGGHPVNTTLAQHLLLGCAYVLVLNSDTGAYDEVSTYEWIRQAAAKAA